MSKRPPRIAFYGGMANNCYLVASQMHAMGMEVVHILDHQDLFAISQPLWEDCPLMLSYDELNESPFWVPSRWEMVARDLGWKTPDWVVDPKTYSEQSEADRASVADDPELMNYSIAPSDHYKNILAIMRSCDLIFVSNYYTIILAMFSGRPYVICPAGGELMMASGLIRGEGKVGITLEHQRRLMIRGFQASEVVLTRTPFFQHRTLTDGWRNLISIFGKCRFRRVSLPYTTTPQLSQVQKKKLLRQMTDMLGLPPVETPFCIFVPSRIDYRWKGQDRIAQALANHPDRDKFTIIVSGWGADYAHFKESMSHFTKVYVMNCAISKPLLRDMYRACDLVIDQFTIGHIGSAAREAAAVGTPVMAWIDTINWLPTLRPNLPVLNAKNAQDIAKCLSRISTGKINLVSAGEVAQNWIKRYASPELMRDALISEFERIRLTRS